MKRPTLLLSGNILSDTMARLSNESRIITTPWSRIVRGLGLGQYPINYNNKISKWVQDAFYALEEKTESKNIYIEFSSLLSSLIDRLINSSINIGIKDLRNDIFRILDLINHEKNPYHQVMQYSITIEALAKLGLNVFDLLKEHVILSDMLFNSVRKISGNNIKDENSGKHGDYEKISAYTSAFFALANCGKENIPDGQIKEHIANALEAIENVPSPFFRGRGSSMLFSVISLLGHTDMIYNYRHDYIIELLDYLDKADKISINPSFPQPMTPEFIKIYPLLTLLNAIAVTGHKKSLCYLRDRVNQATELLETLTPVEQTHMGLYYIMAIYNLGLLENKRHQINTFVEKLGHTAHNIDPSENYFLHGIACSYVLETAMITGKQHIISDQLVTNLSESFSSMNKNLDDEINRPYPFAYALTMLGEVGHINKIFEPSTHYGEQSASAWIINNISYVRGDNNNRLYMLSNALINLMLRMRGDKFPAPKVYSDFTFPLHCR